MSSTGNQPLRRGDIVEIRPAPEILATLSPDGTLDKMPFMPEMLRYVGRRFRVSSRVDKICDTVSTTGSRRMENTVFLEELRCDGSAHGGCQQGCRIYWKEAWLQKVDEPVPSIATSDPKENVDLERTLRDTTKTVRKIKGVETDVWRCQVTESFVATTWLPTSNLAQYWREMTNGNFSLFRFIFIAIRGFPIEIGRRIGLIGPVPLHGSIREWPKMEQVDFKPGDLVQVKSKREIAATLDKRGFNRGLSFDREMLRYCGKTLRVKGRVKQVIDDKTGRMLKLQKDCIILEGAYCSGELTQGSWYCPRQIYPFWRDSWLSKVEGSPNAQLAKACGHSDQKIKDGCVQKIAMVPPNSASSRPEL